MKKDWDCKLREEVRKCTAGREEYENSMPTLRLNERSLIDRMYVHTHTHKVPGVDDRERGRQMRVQGKRASSREWGILFTWDPRKYVPAYYAQQLSSFIKLLHQSTGIGPGINRQPLPGPQEKEVRI